MSQAIAALALGHGALLAGRMPPASPGLELSKRGDLPSLARSSYMFSRNHLFICNRPFYAVDKQCSLLASAMQSNKRQAESFKRMAKGQEQTDHKDINANFYKTSDMKDDAKHLKELLASFPVCSNEKPEVQKNKNHNHINAKQYKWNDFKDDSEHRHPEFLAQKKMNNKHINAKHYKRSDMNNDSEHHHPEFLSSFPEGSSDPNFKPQSKPSSTDLSTLREIVALFKKAKSKPEEASHVEGQKFQMSESGAKGPVNSVLKVLRQYSHQGAVEESRLQKFGTFSRNGVSRTRSLKGRFSQSSVTDGKSRQESSLTNKVGFERPPSKYVRKSIITAPVVREEEEVVSASYQSRDTEFADDYLSLGHENVTQLESDMEYAAPEYDAPDMLDTLSNTAVKTRESEPLINGTAVQLPDTLNNTDMETTANESLMNGAAGQHSSSLIEQIDLSTLKLSELKIIAKSRGLKGFSKLKKSELIELLREGTN